MVYEGGQLLASKVVSFGQDVNGRFGGMVLCCERCEVEEFAAFASESERSFCRRFVSLICKPLRLA